MAVRVRRAWFTAGSRKAVTPLLTASTPVIMAVQPLAKARIKSQNDAPISAGAGSGSELTETGLPPDSKLLPSPIKITARSETMNR